MQQPDFPLFSSDKAARSWGCCACHSTNITATVGDENFPHGRGHYRYQCLDCKLYTWFDLEKPNIYCVCGCEEPPRKPIDHPDVYESCPGCGMV
jgi:hypothetical protein